MKNIFLLILFLIVTQTSIAFTTDYKSSNSIDTITYSILGFNSKISLYLLSDNRFIQESSYFDCVSITTTCFVLGIYKQKENHIELLPKNVQVLIEDYKKPEATIDTLMPFNESGFSIKKEYYQVEIRGIEYLLSAEKKEEFSGEISATNDFEELLKAHLENDYTWESYFKEEKVPKSNFTIDDLSEPWKKFLEPINTKTYHIQLGIFRNPKNFDTTSFRKFGMINYLKLDKSLTLIYLGQFKTYEEAKVIKDKLHKEGKETMIIATKNGKKVPN